MNELAALLRAAGWDVAGPAGTLASLCLWQGRARVRAIRKLISERLRTR